MNKDDNVFPIDNEEYQEPYPELFGEISTTTPTAEELRSLFDAAERIKKIKPWEKLWDNDLIIIELPDRSEPVFISIMGKGGLCYGITAYPGFSSLASGLRVRTAQDDEPSFITASYNNCLACYFMDRDSITDKDKELCDIAQVRYRGAHQWICFKCLRTGYMPWQYSAEQCRLMTEILNQTEYALKELFSGNYEIDFSAEQSFRHYYDQKSASWKDMVLDSFHIPLRIQQLIITDELMPARLRRCPELGNELEVDILYLPHPVNSAISPIPIYPRIILIVDVDEEQIADQHLLTPEQSADYVLLEVLNDYILKNGRPGTIAVRDDNIAGILKDLCDKTGIELIANEGLPLINNFAESILHIIQKGLN